MYTSIFKAFNQQYRADKKSIQALSINVIKKLSDEAALDILNQLKLYHEKLDLFINNSAAYAQVLGYHFTGIDSNWDLIIQLADICLAVQKAFKGSVPEKTAFELSRDHQAFNASLSSYTDNATDALTKARDIIEKNQFKVDCKTSEIHTQEIIKATETLTEEANINLANGGRGIGNVVENLLINPLSRYLFDNEIFENAEVTIDEIDTASNPPALICTRSSS